MELLEPGMSIQPNLNLEAAISLVQRLYGFKVVKIRQLNGYDDKNYHVQVNTKYNTLSYLRNKLMWH